jgi:hypothetical protein
MVVGDKWFVIILRRGMDTRQMESLDNYLRLLLLT